jgi:hypothetical protein
MTLALTGTSGVSQEACKRFLLQNNPNASPEIIDHYYELENAWGLRADLLTCQMFHETGYLASWWSGEPRRNPAGLGVTGEISATDPKSNIWAYNPNTKKWEKGLSFPDWNTAALTHYAHMSAYVYPDERNNASKIDPRYTAAHALFTSGKWTYCKVLSDLNGRWAVPGVGYGESIEKVYNLIAAQPISADHQSF